MFSGPGLVKNGYSHASLQDAGWEGGVTAGFSAKLLGTSVQYGNSLLGYLWQDTTIFVLLQQF